MLNLYLFVFCKEKHIEEYIHKRQRMSNGRVREIKSTTIGYWKHKQSKRMSLFDMLYVCVYMAIVVATTHTTRFYNIQIWCTANRTNTKIITKH